MSQNSHTLPVLENFSTNPHGKTLLKELYYSGCGCEKTCSVDCSCSRHSYLKVNVLANENLPVFECNSLCGCGQECPNRIIQHGTRKQLEKFSTTAKGKGVKSIDCIEKGEFVVEYCGEIISVSESKKRFQEYDKVGLNYLLVIREYTSDKNSCMRTNIDATSVECIARYINHSCDANLTPIIVRVNSRIPRVALFANRLINKGEEITFDYGYMDRDCENSLSKFKCHCGASICRKLLPFNPNL